MKFHYPSILFIFSIGLFLSSCFTITTSSSLHFSTFNVLHYGAVGNGKTDDSQAFLKAWEAACGAKPAGGNGIPSLHVPIGMTFLLNPLSFHGPCNSKYINFNVQGTLLSPKKNAWPKVDLDKWIQFSDIDGLIVNGAGQLDGQGASWWNDCHSDGCQRPTALFFHNCNGLELSHTRHINSGKNHISINGCNGVKFSKLQILAPDQSPNTDGIDISRSTNVLIQDSFIGTGDDCVAINSGSFFINIVGVTCGPGHGISVGSLGEDGEHSEVGNVNVKNCVFKGTQNGVRIKTWQGGSGYARNISFEEITLINSKNPIIIDQHYDDALVMGNKLKGGDVKVSDVTYRKVHGSSASENAIVLDCSRIGCSNIVFEVVRISTGIPGKEAKAICKNVGGKSISVYPPIPCLSNS